MKTKSAKQKTLAVDIGNTMTHLAVFDNGQAKGMARFKTGWPRARLSNKVSALFKKRLYQDIDQVILCSVVPRRTKMIADILSRSCRQKVRIVGQGVKVPLRNRYRRPAQVGRDRLVGAFAAVQLYKPPVIIVDLGTAITLDVVSKQCEYMGGLIVPGLGLSTAALHHNTALLPLVEIRKPTEVIGRDTRSSILSGIFYGYGSMLTGLIDILSKQVRGRPKIIMTGGYADLMRKYFHRNVIIERDLVLKGLHFLSTSRR